MNNGVFITLYDEESLKLYLKNGLFGFLATPVNTSKPNPRSNYFHVLADYACLREGSDVFFFIKRKIYYGGKVIGNESLGSFFINGENSPLGRSTKANLFWNEDFRYEKDTSLNKGQFYVETNNGRKIKAQPFIVCFNTSDDSGKFITSDDLYFELGSYPFPLPSNAMQGMGFCTLTPGETKIALNLIGKSKNRIDYSLSPVCASGGKRLFSEELIDPNYMNESELEFNLLANFDKFLGILGRNHYCLCRQIPISPFKPENMDRADICLYDTEDLIQGGTLPNVVIELKDEKANFHAYEQVHRYLRWLEKVTEPNEFEKIEAYIVAPSFFIKKKKIFELGIDKYIGKIKFYSLDEGKFEALK